MKYFSFAHTLLYVYLSCGCFKRNNRRLKKLYIRTTLNHKVVCENRKLD